MVCSRKWTCSFDHMSQSKGESAKEVQALSSAQRSLPFGAARRNHRPRISDALGNALGIVDYIAYTMLLHDSRASYPAHPSAELIVSPLNTYD